MTGSRRGRVVRDQNRVVGCLLRGRGRGRAGTWPSYGLLLLLLMRPVRDRRRVRYTPGSVPVCWVIGESERTKARIWGWTTTRYVHSSLVDRLGTNCFELEQPTVSETVESGWWSIRGTGKTVPCRISVQRGQEFRVPRGRIAAGAAARWTRTGKFEHTTVYSTLYADDLGFCTVNGIVKYGKRVHK